MHKKTGRIASSLVPYVEHFGNRLRIATVLELAEEGAIFVEDGNHGENRPRQNEFSETGIPFIRPPDLKDGRVDFTSCGRINEAGFDRVRKGIGRAGDIILTHRATVGRIAITSESDPPVFVTNPGTTIWRSTDATKIDQRYLYCYLRSPGFMQQLWGQVGNNSTFDYVSLTQQRGLQVALPPLPEQKAIAHILGTLDDKIELNRRMNETLESMARALFKSWFVDFDPVRAKMDGRQPPGLSADLAALFPDELVHVDGELIPAGWKFATIDECTSLIIDHRGKTPKKLGSDWSADGIPAVSAKNIKDGRMIRPETFKFVDESLYKKWMKDELAEGDILMTSEAPLGELYFLSTGSRFCLSQRLYGIRPDRKVCLPTYAYFWLLSDDAQTDLQSRATGTTVVGIRQSELRMVRVLVPPITIQQQADNILMPMLRQIEACENQSQTLANARDALLPNLLSGKLDLPT